MGIVDKPLVVKINSRVKINILKLSANITKTINNYNQQQNFRNNPVHRPVYDKFS